MPSGGWAPRYPSSTQSAISNQKNHLWIGRKRELRTGEVSSHGRKNSTMIEPNIRITPSSLAGMNSTSNVMARRIA